MNFMTTFNSSFANINVTIADPKYFISMAASVAESDAINPKGTKRFLANGASTFFINGKPAAFHYWSKKVEKSSSFISDFCIFAFAFLISIFQRHDDFCNIFYLIVCPQNSLCNFFNSCIKPMPLFSNSLFVFILYSYYLFILNMNPPLN